MATSDVRPDQIERFAVDSTNIKSVGFADGCLTVQFTNGHIYAYQVEESVFVAFAAAESKGKHFNQQIRGKFTGRKLTGKCAQCGSEPEIIGVACSDCGGDTVREIDRVHKERP